tara:strand:+ start:1612 stop:1905 length:294 start_codon:yes stop_codon:yes gene_type:complete
MKEKMKEVKQLLEEYVLSAVDERIQINLFKGMLGSKTPYETNLTTQMTLDDFIDEENGVPSYLVFDVFINPRFLNSWSVNKMAMEIRQDFVKKNIQE